MQYFQFILTVVVVSIYTHSAPAVAQTAPDGTAQGFTPENAILDTAIPFAIGAQEARQSLRGAFGWETFQEGLVEGVYFRFDPDGYARFAPTPRLDTDVFEVICRSRTYSCMGRKEGVSMTLDSRGQLQLKFDDIALGDTFYVSEGVSEIQIPERILQPMDQPLEALLATGGELIIRRGDNVVNSISLTGFSTVASYLRWIVARQDYASLPRGWPVPNSVKSTDYSGGNRVNTWNSPRPQSQTITPIQSSDLHVGQVNEDVAEVRGELNILRELLLERERGGNFVQPDPQNIPTISHAELPMSTTSDRLSELQIAADQIREEIEILQRNRGQLVDTAPAFSSTQPVQETSQRHVTKPVSSEKIATGGLATQLQYLIDVIGLEPHAAISVLQGKVAQLGTASQNTQITQPISDASTALDSAADIGTLYQEDVVSQILKELEDELTEPEVPGATLQSKSEGIEISRNEFQLLSQYFKSVVLPKLVQ